jgi:hypothetical protein
MRDFASPYRKVAYFGLWAQETADQYGKRDAMGVLADAAGCCLDDDVRQRPELLRALEYLCPRNQPRRLRAAFQKGPRRTKPVIGFQAANDAWRALARRIGLP